MSRRAVARLSPLVLALVGGLVLPAGALGDDGAPPRGGGASPAGAPRIELYTMGPGDEAFARFGHAALCVVPGDGAGPGRCYNYGTADFGAPVALTWAVLRDRARFWVSETTPARLLASYRASDRSVYRQVLPLGPEAAVALARRVADDALPEHRAYTYHHFLDNCATRLRDRLDAATGGALSAGADAPLGPSYRDLVRRGFGGELALLLPTELILGRAVDRRLSVWEGMFLPDVLRAEVAARLGATPEVLHRRAGAGPGGSTRLGARALVALAAALGALGAFAAWAAVGRPRAAALARAVSGSLLFLLALPVDAVALVSSLPELRANELLLVLLPTDLALVWLRGRRLRAYVAARLLLLVPVALAAAAGLLAQPVWPPLAVVVLALVPLLAGARRAPCLHPQEEVRAG